MRCQILLRLFSVRFPTRRYRGPGTYHCENPMRIRLVTGVDESCRKRMTDIGGVSAGYKLALAGCGGTKSPAHFHITALGHSTILRPSSNTLQVAIRISFVACSRESSQSSVPERAVYITRECRSTVSVSGHCKEEFLAKYWI